LRGCKRKANRYGHGHGDGDGDLAAKGVHKGGRGVAKGGSGGGRGGQHPWHVAAVAANYESVVVAFRLLSFVCNIQMHLADNLLLC